MRPTIFAPFAPRFLLAVALLGTLAVSPARAALQDELQVYDDGINEPGEFGVELHVNTTPRGIATPSYPGEKISLHGWRFTPEFSWGWTRTVELGLYVPVVMDADRHVDLAGLKARIKWLPVQPDPTQGGMFAGFNFELARVKPSYDPARYATESKLMLGHRSPRGLLSFNLNMGNELEGPRQGDRSEFRYAIKATRQLRSTGWSGGLEYYQDLGAIGRPLPRDEQERRLYAIAEWDRTPWSLHFGIGRGLTPVTDDLTVKFIAEIPINLLN
jgi:hypothetical protein